MIMEQWFVCLILPAVTWLLYMGYRLRQGKGRSGEKNTGHGPEESVSETQSDIPVSEATGWRFDEDRDAPDWEAVIEGIAACGTTLPEAFSAFRKNVF